LFLAPINFANTDFENRKYRPVIRKIGFLPAILQKLNIAPASLAFLIEHTVAPRRDPELLRRIVVVGMVIVFESGVEVQLSLTEAVEDGVLGLDLKQLIFGLEV